MYDVYKVPSPMQQSDYTGHSLVSRIDTIVDKVGLPADKEVCWQVGWGTEAVQKGYQYRELNTRIIINAEKSKTPSTE